MTPVEILGWIGLVVVALVGVVVVTGYLRLQYWRRHHGGERR
jgi:hypothetical protein